MKTNKRKKILSIPIAFALLLILTGCFGRIYHWPSNFELRIVGLTLLGVLYVTRYLSKQSKTLKDTFKMLMVLSWVVVTTLGVFKLGYIPYVVYLSLSLGFCWFILEIIDLIKKETSNNNVNPILWLGIILMILFVLIKIQYWPFGSLVYIFGLFISSIGFIVDYFANRKEIT